MPGLDVGMIKFQFDLSCMFIRKSSNIGVYYVFTSVFWHTTLIIFLLDNIICYLRFNYIYNLGAKFQNAASF